MKSLKHSFLVAVAAFGLAFSASAINLTIGDLNYLGSVDPGIPPGDNELGWVNYLAGMTPGDVATNVPPTHPAQAPDGQTLTRSGNDFGALPLAESGVKVEDPAQGTWVVGASSLYLLGKYGQGNTDVATHVWYLGNLAVGTEVTLPLSGLSHDVIFSGPRNDVPEGGLTLAMLGAGLAGMGLIRRRLS